MVHLHVYASRNHGIDAYAVYDRPARPHRTAQATSGNKAIMRATLQPSRTTRFSSPGRRARRRKMAKAAKRRDRERSEFCRR